MKPFNLGGPALLPCININRHDAGLYEWAIVIGCDPEPMDSEIGESSISACLSAAASRLPVDVSWAEVRYRGFHVRTHAKQELEDAPEMLADRIESAYGAYRQSQ